MRRKLTACLLLTHFVLSACHISQSSPLSAMQVPNLCESQEGCLSALLEQQDFEMLSRFLLVAPPEILNSEEKLALFKALWTQPVALRRFLKRYHFPQAFQALPNEEALKLQFFQTKINPSLNTDLLKSLRLLQQQSDASSPLIQDLKLFWRYWLGQAIQAHDLRQLKAILLASDYQNWESDLKLRLKAQALQALNIDAFELLGGEPGDPILDQKDLWLPFLNRPWRGALFVLEYWLEQKSLNDNEFQALLRIVSGDNHRFRHHPAAITKLLHAGHSLTHKDPRGLMALHYYFASSGASWPLIADHVVLSQHMNHFDLNGNSLLMYAVRGGNMDIIQRLLQAGLSPHLRSSQRESSSSHLINAPAGSSVLTQSLGNANLDAFYYFSESLDIYAEPRNLLSMTLQRIALPRSDNSDLRRQQTKALRPTLRLLAEGYPVDREVWDQMAIRQCVDCIPLFIQKTDLTVVEIIKSLTQSTQLLYDEKAFFDMHFYLRLIQQLEMQIASLEPYGVLSFNQALKKILIQARQEERLLADDAEIERFFQRLRSQEVRMLSLIKSIDPTTTP